MARKRGRVEPPELKLTDYKPYRDLLERRQALAAERQEALDRMEELRPRLSSVADAAEALAHGEEDEYEEHKAELRALERREIVLCAAVERCNTRLRKELKPQAQAALVEPLLEEYRSILERFAEAAVALGKVAEEEAAYCAALKREGLGVGPLQPPVPSHFRLSIPSPLTDTLDRLERRHGIRVNVERASLGAR